MAGRFVWRAAILTALRMSAATTWVLFPRKLRGVSGGKPADLISCTRRAQALAGQNQALTVEWWTVCPRCPFFLVVNVESHAIGLQEVLKGSGVIQ